MGAVAAEQLVLRAMTHNDVVAACELSREQNWPHREEDWGLFLDVGEGILAELDGKVVGSIMGWRFGKDMAALGLVIVTDAMQGRGIGRKLMNAMIEQLKGRSIVLNATEEGAPLYAKLGFVEIGTIHQHQAKAPTVPLAALVPGERVRPRGKADTDLCEMYSRASGMDRTTLFSALSAQSRTVVLTHDDLPVGFAMFRRFGRGWSVAPVVAPDQGGAKALISHWLCVKHNRFCRLDVSEESGLSEWLEELGLPKVGTVKTMVLGKAPVTDPDIHVYSLAAQALG